MMYGSIPDTICIYFSYGGVLSVETFAGACAIEDPDFTGQMSVQSRRPCLKRILAAGDINVSHLSESMDPGICPACSVQIDLAGKNFCKRMLHMVLDSVSIRLRLPPAERASVVGNG